MSDYDPPDPRDRVLAPSGQCLNFGCPCRPEDHPVIYIFDEEDYP